MEFGVIKKTPLYTALSEQGKRIYLPQGIFYWSGRAKKEAEIMGTLGSAFGFEEDFIEGGAPEWVPLYLEDIKDYTKMNVNEVVPYTKVAGLVNLKNSWKNWVIKKSCYSIDYEKDKLNRLENFITTPVVTAGLTNGIFLCCSLLLNHGDFLISPNKRWGNYDNIIEKLIGAKIKSFDLFSGDTFNIIGMINAIYEISKVQEKIVLILGFPNNPTGFIPTQEELDKILDALKEAQKTISKPIIILVDDAYEPFVYSKEVINSSIFYALHEITEDIIPIKLDGITKELLLYGGRIGFITIGLKPHWVKNPEEFTTLKAEIDNKLSGLVRTTVSNCNQFYQSLILKLFNDIGMDNLIKKRDKIKILLKARYEKINKEFGKIKNDKISVDKNAGGFFIFVNLNPSVIKATDFADHLLKKYKVGVIPIEKPHDNINGIRIAYCSIDIRKIPEFVDRIDQALRDF